MKKRGSRLVLGLVLILSVCFLFLLSLSLGSVAIPFKEIVKILLGLPVESSAWQKIVLLFRLPKALAALLAGAALSVSGLLMQTLFRNPLAGPSVLGINAGAGLGVAVTVLAAGGGVGGATLLEGFSWFGQVSLVVSSAIGAGLVLVVIMFLSRRIDNIMTLLILGLLFGYAAEAGVSILMHLSVAERVQAYIFWSFGSFSGVTWDSLWVFALFVILGLLLGFGTVKQLNALLLGEGYAFSMGVRIRRTRRLIILSTALLAGVTTAFCGPITFIGIAIPHLARVLFASSDHKLLLPASLLLGSSSALLSDIVSQVPGQDLLLPLNAVTSILGAPVVIWVILKRKNLQESF